MAIQMTVADDVFSVINYVLSFPTGCLGWNLGVSENFFYFLLFLSNVDPAEKGGKNIRAASPEDVPAHSKAGG